jgi:hypothetical protein
MAAAGDEIALLQVEVGVALRLVHRLLQELGVSAY